MNKGNNKTAYYLLLLGLSTISLFVAAAGAYITM